MIAGHFRARVRELEREINQLLELWKHEPKRRLREGINDAIIDNQKEYKAITTHYYYGQAKNFYK